MCVLEIEIGYAAPTNTSTRRREKTTTTTTTTSKMMSRNACICRQAHGGQVLLVLVGLFGHWLVA
jgi:hypothetical protein